jgi:hypothetical protein
MSTDDAQIKKLAADRLMHVHCDHISAAMEGRQGGF